MSTNSTVGRHDLLGLHDLGERVEPRVRHRHDADVRVDRAERIVLRRDLRARERVEQRRLADVRQSDDAALDAHDYSLSFALVSAGLLRDAVCSWRSPRRAQDHRRCIRGRVADRLDDLRFLVRARALST